MIDEINSLIKDVAHEINYDACDYEMSMALFPCQVSEGEVHTIASSAFSKPVSVIEVQPATTQELLDTVNYALTYTGHAPSPYMNTSRHQNDVRLVKKAFGHLLYSGEKVYKFHLNGNHPFCPIMWEFAYCIVFKTHAVVFIASASD